MRAHRFRLESVLRVRELQERVAREALMSAQRTLREAQRVHHAAYAALAGSATPARSLTGTQLEWSSAQFLRRVESVRASAETLQRASSVRAHLQLDWSVSKKRVGALESLAQHSLERWRVDAARDERMELDDLTIYRYSHGVVSP